jgi:hypothetical protein
MSKVKSGMGLLLAVLLMVSMVAIGCPPPVVPVPPPPVASLALQVNPAITLTLNERNIVIGAEGLDTNGELLLAELVVTGKEISQALRVIAEALHRAGFLEDGRRILTALNPIEDRIGEAELIALTGVVDQMLRGYVAEHGLVVEVTSVVLTAELADAIRVVGLFPADYVDLVVEVGSPMAMQVIGLQGELGLDLTLFKDEFGTIASAKIDMLDAGITENNALAILKSSLIADPTLEELTTITAATIDLHEVGATQEGIMAVFTLVEEQIAAGVDRTLLLEEFTTITAAKVDMLEAGITGDNSLAILRGALVADPTLEELTTITAAMIDLHEVGATQEGIMAVFTLVEEQIKAGVDQTLLLEEFTTITAAKANMLEAGVPAAEALDRIQAAIEADPALQKFDDRIEEYLIEEPAVEEPAVEEPAVEEPPIEIPPIEVPPVEEEKAEN